MTVLFNDEEIPGTHGIVEEGPIELHSRHTYFFGLKGVSEIVSGVGGRPLVIDIWIHNNYASLAALNQYLYTLDAVMGTNATLETVFGAEEDQDTRNQVFENCTFLGLERLPIGGRPRPGPIQDVAGTIDGGWFLSGRLHFYQLRVDPPPVEEEEE